MQGFERRVGGVAVEGGGWTTGWRVDGGGVEEEVEWPEPSGGWGREAGGGEMRVDAGEQARPRRRSIWWRSRWCGGGGEGGGSPEQAIRAGARFGFRFGTEVADSGACPV